MLLRKYTGEATSHEAFFLFLPSLSLSLSPPAFSCFGAEEGRGQGSGVRFLVPGAFPSIFSQVTSYGLTSVNVKFTFSPFKLHFRQFIWSSGELKSMLALRGRGRGRKREMKIRLMAPRLHRWLLCVRQVLQ